MDVLTPTSPKLKNTSNFHIQNLQKDGFVVTPNQSFEKGLAQLIKDLNRLLLLNNVKLTTEALSAGLAGLENDPQFKLFIQCYNQTLLSFFVDAINAGLIPQGFMVTGQDYKANLDTESLTLSIENKMLLIGRPGSDEQYFIPGNIKINFQLGPNGIELAKTQTSNSVLQRLFLATASQISSDLSLEAKLKETPEMLYESYRSLILFFNKPTVDYHALGGLTFIQKIVDEINLFLKFNPDYAKKLAADSEFESALQQLDPKKLLIKEIGLISHPILKNLHLALLQGLGSKGIKINKETLSQVRDFVSALNQQKELNYNTYLKIAPPFLKLDKENFPNTTNPQKSPPASPTKRKPLGDMTNKTPIKFVR